MEIVNLEISQRAYNALMRAGYRELADLEGVTDEDLLALPQFGVGALKEIRQFADGPTNELSIAEVCRFLAEGWNTRSAIVTVTGAKPDQVDEVLAALEEHQAVFRTAAVYTLNPYLAVRFRERMVA